MVRMGGMSHLLIFGLGYTAKRIAACMKDDGWSLEATGADGTLDFADSAAVSQAIKSASHVLSSVPPAKDGAEPVLDSFGDQLSCKPLFYLSSTGVYGDTGGAWADESTPVGTGRRQARSAAEARWLEMGACSFRLPGIYGPGRSAFDRITAGKARRIDLAEQVFSRVHVDDIARGLALAMMQNAPAGAYNLADDLPCSQNAVIEYACDLMGISPPPLQSLEEAGLSDMAKGFYAENRRIANGKAKRILGWQMQYPTYREGLRAIRAISGGL